MKNIIKIKNGFILIRTSLRENLDSVKGFTLIELLVVMAVIGVLATMVIAYGRTSIRRNRDTQRKSDLSNLSNALELFYSNYGVYPMDNANGQILGCPYMPAGGSEPCGWGNSQFSDEAGEVYFNKIPKDPRPNYTTYFYDVSPTRDRYVIFAALENPEDINIDPQVEEIGMECADPSGSGSVRCNFAVTSSDTLITDLW